MPNMNATISLRILTLKATGMTTAEAIDAVLGAGTYDKIVDDLYNGLRAKAGV